MKLFTVTPNPALDLSGTVETLLPDEKNYVTNTRKDPGGNGINASRIASRLKIPTIAMGFLGGATGKEIQILLKKEKITTRMIPILEETRTNVTVTRLDRHQQTRLTFPGPTIRKLESKKLLAFLSGLRSPGILAIGGSLPQGVSQKFHIEMIQAALKNPHLGILVDVPAQYLRPITQRFSHATQPPLLLVKPNDHELEEWAGKRLSSQNEQIEVARKLLGTFAVVCLSLGKEGALWITRKTTLRGIPPSIRAKGSVGAGDSMVGGICSRLLLHRCNTPGLLSHAPESLHSEALKWGLAAGAATAEVTGTGLAYPKEIQRLLGQVRVDHPLGG
jgi:1-phosphofructokinase family hexose kinase